MFQIIFEYEGLTLRQHLYSGVFTGMSIEVFRRYFLFTPHTIVGPNSEGRSPVYRFDLQHGVVFVTLCYGAIDNRDAVMILCRCSNGLWLVNSRYTNMHRLAMRYWLENADPELVFVNGQCVFRLMAAFQREVFDMDPLNWYMEEML